jgi:membrane fusion protein, multidrug efflux system
MTPARRFTAFGRLWLVGTAVGILLVGAGAVWHYYSQRESTDDAQVAGHVSPVAARVGGTIRAIRVQDNQAVKAGDVLVELDPRDHELALERAEADLAAATAAASAARVGVPITSATARSEQTAADAGAGHAAAAVTVADREIDASRAKLASTRARLDEAQATAAKARSDYARLEPLAAKDEISRQQLDAARTGAEAAAAAAESARAGVTEAEANLKVTEARRTQAGSGLTQAEAQASAAATAPQQIALIEARARAAEAQVQQAQAAVDQARLNLERAVVRALVDGVVSRRTVEIGQVVQPGQVLLAITSLDDVWVTANFKETQLGRIAPGQTAEVTVDALGGRRYHGRVDSIAAATGATFSLLPPDNASGNFVKVVQRVPVKIVIDRTEGAAAVLRPGMSVNATIFVR